MKLNQLKTGVMLSYLYMFLHNAIAIVYTPIMLRLLGQSEYGLYNLVNSAISYLGLLNFGFDTAYIRYYSRYRAKNDEESIARLNGMFIVVFSVIAVIALAAGSVLTLNTKNIFAAKLSVGELDRAQVLMAILTLNMALTFVFTVFQSHITANEKYIFQRLLNIVKAITSPFAMLIVLFAGFGSVGMVTVTTLLNLAVKIADVIYCRKKLDVRFSFHGLDFGLLKEISVFSWFIFINIIVDQINWNVDKFLLGIYRGTTAVAVYGLAAQLNTYYMSFTTSVSSVFVPKINRMAAVSEERKGFNELFVKVGRIQFFILSLALTALIFLGRPFIRLWAGDNYGASYPIALMLIIPITIPLVQTIGMEIQRALNMHKFRAYLYLFIAISNLLMSIPLCRRFGGIGCAAGTAAALIIGNGIIMNIYYHKKMKLDILNFWRQILKIIPSLIPSAIAGVIIMKTIDIKNIWIFLAAASVYAAVFAVSVYLFGMNNYEKNLIKNALGKLKKGLFKNGAEKNE